MPIPALIFALVYLTLIMLAIFRRPMFGLYAYLTALYLHPPSNWWGEALPDLRWSLIAAVATLTSVLIHNRNALKLVWTRELVLMIAFLALVTGQLFSAVSHKDQLVYVDIVFAFVLLMVMIPASLQSRDDVAFFILANLIGCSYFGYIGMTRSWGGRLDGVGGPGFSTANFLGQHVGTILFMGAPLLLAWRKRLLASLLVLALMLVAAKVILMAGSRGVYVAAAITAVMAVYFVPNKFRKKVFGALMFAGIILLVSERDFLMSRFVDLDVTNIQEVGEESAQSRVEVAKAQIAMFEQAPLVGHGHRGTYHLSAAYMPEQYLAAGEDGQRARSSHNFLLTLLVDHGLLGTLLFGSIVVSCFFRWTATSTIALDNSDAEFLQLMFLGMICGLFFQMVAGMFSDHNRAETDVWLYALIPYLSMKLKESVSAG